MRHEAAVTETKMGYRPNPVRSTIMHPTLIALLAGAAIGVLGYREYLRISLVREAERRAALRAALAQAVKGGIEIGMAEGREIGEKIGIMKSQEFRISPN